MKLRRSSRERSNSASRAKMMYLYKVRILKKLYEDAKKFSVLDVIKLRDFIMLADIYSQMRLKTQGT